MTSKYLSSEHSHGFFPSGTLLFGFNERLAIDLTVYSVPVSHVRFLRWVVLGGTEVLKRGGVYTSN